MKAIGGKWILGAVLAALAAGLWGCAGSYKPDPTREARQTEIIRYMQSSSEGRGYY